MQLKIPYGEHVRAEYRSLVARERQLRLPSCRKGTNAAEGLQFFLRPVKQSFSTESTECGRSIAASDLAVLTLRRPLSADEANIPGSSHAHVETLGSARVGGTKVTSMCGPKTDTADF